ncbi:hypothetical protein C8258_01050 [Nocardia sp. MDA0666]|nr:hypothetical protein C8258_01050 [Nocardia sp. MDA0666]
MFGELLEWLDDIGEHDLSFASGRMDTFKAATAVSGGPGLLSLSADGAAKAGPSPRFLDSLEVAGCEWTREVIRRRDSL